VAVHPAAGVGGFWTIVCGVLADSRLPDSGAVGIAGKKPVATGHPAKVVTGAELVR
jgi:hypothetical protein